MDTVLFFPIAQLHGFLLVLTRVASTIAFVPLPQLRNAAATARVVISLALTLVLQASWPEVPVDLNGGAMEVWRLLARLAGEALFGASIGLIVAMLGECLILAAQVLGVQTGYGYASTIDPNTEADSGVLLVMAQWTSWMLFLAFGMDRVVLRALARSLQVFPAGAFAITPQARAAVLGFGSAVFTTALRLALPMIALLLLVDVAFALFGRVHAQLQLLSLAFPAKMLVSLAMLAALTQIFPSVYEGIAAHAVSALMRVSGD